MNAKDGALLALLRHLAGIGYRFVTPTPATHARVLARGRTRARTLADALGWSLPFAPGALDPAVEALLAEAGMLDSIDGLHKARLRIASLAGRLYLHSAYPTEQDDAVFFGPDSYRFARLIEEELADPEAVPARILDIGTGAGVGGIVAAAARPAAEVVMTDINPAALRLARLNALHAGVNVALVETATLAPLAGRFDLVIANPPYIIDDAGRAYRDGGDLHGAALSLEMARMALAKLAPGGRLVLYTGSAIVAGEDGLHRRLAELAEAHGYGLRYRELDPDVFGEELEKPAYADVDRIALVAATIVADRA
jgi:methylase of polypeptide subunit release factors